MEKEAMRFLGIAAGIRELTAQGQRG